ncbi:MAG: hypothetical protein Q9166_002932 [cf. Caloplaca sp. 2 TL-2023]
MRRGSTTLRQRNDSGAHGSDALRNKHQDLYAGPGRIQRGLLGGAKSTRDRSGRTGTKSATPTRAERRAALYGHLKNPPEGYKGLPSKSSKQQQWGQGIREDHRERLAVDRSRHHDTSDFKVFGEAKNTGSHRDRLPSGRLKTRGGTDTRDVHSPWNTSDVHGSTNTYFREKGLDHSGEQSSEDRPRRKSSTPLAIPYTTPASEFLYGHSVVTMALKFSRRTFYKLYLYNGDVAEVRGQDSQVRKLALAANVEVTRVGNDWVKLMDKMSGGRPHNGYILEASPLPKLPVTSLDSVPSPQSTFEVVLDHQSREEEAVNGNNTTVPYGNGYHRYPFLLLLDGIRDTGNLGAILRSSHFLGADGVLICTRNSAPLTPVALKAAAGAAETLPLFSVGQPGSFIDECQDNGWKLYAAVSPSSSDSARAAGRPYYSTATLGNPTTKHPCILMLGSEGDGLRWNIQKKADYLLGIEAQRTGYGELDSLNVSVASALLCDAFLKGPVMAGKGKMNRKAELADAMEGDNVRQDIDQVCSSQDGEHGVASDQRLF